MGTDKTELLREIADYYSDKLAEHGETPQGVDWNGSDSQVLRFEQLSKVIADEDTPFSIMDLGCGYGALYEFLSPKYPQMSYLGLDVSEIMVEAAKARYAHPDRVDFLCASQPDRVSDYCVASGIFNVRQNRTDAEWGAFLENTLDMIHESSARGFAFNCLTAYSDADKKRGYLYYADPCWLFDLCKRKYARNIAVLHDYGLYEFTILVRK
ncbi:class I SAM-dependent methyltransferase [Roseobacter sp. YSTF-M11]|uniref:Class I SAM-dependent methyltransferase n=1 Tax=Roseobacter insulae TaxID=2859783 RepID=A0A9X1K4P7_9RHOB|nr:class I SAM-dependent methyltransferase [Roseobacter insulae]MBW4710818.1 class I SAM-dependent methyltransferase [Roseobacter insulae]